MWRITAFLSLATIAIARQGVNADPMVPCFFIFGDSLFDAGNNNGLKTRAKANFPPYGVDYLGGVPTGRFTNGRTGADVLAEHLGFHGYIPPFTTAKGEELLKGVNYASGSCGIRNETGQHLGVCINLGQQLEHHESVINKLKGMVKGSVQDHLNKCLYTINIGSNDYINNYFMPKIYPTSRQYKTHDQYAAALINEYAKNIKVLYESGARKIAVFGLGLIGCSLGEVAQFHPRTPCVNSINIAVAFFNKRLRFLVDQLTHTLPGINITYINYIAVQMDLLQARRAGVTVANKPCCMLREDYQCREKTNPCINRNNYAFYDGFHPTEAVNRITAGRAFKAVSDHDVHPYDICHLVNL